MDNKLSKVTYPITSAAYFNTIHCEYIRYISYLICILSISCIMLISKLSIDNFLRLSDDFLIKTNFSQLKMCLRTTVFFALKTNFTKLTIRMKTEAGQVFINVLFFSRISAGCSYKRCLLK